MYLYMYINILYTEITCTRMYNQNMFLWSSFERFLRFASIFTEQMRNSTPVGPCEQCDELYLLVSSAPGYWKARTLPSLSCEGGDFGNQQCELAHGTDQSGKRHRMVPSVTISLACHSIAASVAKETQDESSLVSGFRHVLRGVARRSFAPVWIHLDCLWKWGYTKLYPRGNFHSRSGEPVHSLNNFFNVLEFSKLVSC